MCDLEVNIDFNTASKEWHKNKKSVGNGMFVYTCKYINHKGNKCGKTVYSCIRNEAYNYGFGGVSEYDPLKHHKNVKKACKRHLNRIDIPGKKSD